MLQFTSNIELSLNTEMFELFCGEAAVSSVFRRAGVATVSYDREMAPGKRNMDFLTPSGFAFQPHFFRNIQRYNACGAVCTYLTGHPSSLPCLQCCRLSMVCILKECPNAFNLVAPDCGSFSLVSRGTSRRSPINPLGQQGVPFVFRGNGTISRWGG